MSKTKKSIATFFIVAILFISIFSTNTFALGYSSEAYPSRFLNAYTWSQSPPEGTLINLYESTGGLDNLTQRFSEASVPGRANYVYMRSSGNQNVAITYTGANQPYLTAYSVGNGKSTQEIKRIFEGNGYFGDGAIYGLAYTNLATPVAMTAGGDYNACLLYTSRCV